MATGRPHNPAANRKRATINGPNAGFAATTQEAAVDLASSQSPLRCLSECVVATYRLYIRIRKTALLVSTRAASRKMARWLESRASDS